MIQVAMIENVDIEKPMTSMSIGELCTFPARNGMVHYVYRMHSNDIEFLVVNLSIGIIYDKDEAEEFYVTTCKDGKVTVVFSSNSE